MFVTIYLIECVLICVYAAWSKTRYLFAAIVVKSIIAMLQAGSLNLKVTFQDLITQ